MKKSIGSVLPLCSTLALLAALLEPGRVSAQLQPPEATRPAANRDSGHLPPYTLEIVNGELTVGRARVPATLSKIADLVRDQHPEANLVLAPELGQVTVTDLKLRSTELAETLEALRVASGNVFVWHRGMAENQIDPRTGLPVPPPQGATLLYVLQPNENITGLRPTRMVEVFNLSGYLAQLGQNDPGQINATLHMLQAIVDDTLDRVTEGRVKPGERPSFQFHQGANLFIAIGPPEAIEVARKVVMALPGVVATPPETSPRRVETSRQNQQEMMRRYGVTPPAGAPAPGETPQPGPGAPPQRK